jgi:large subunit ribosomal protein L23
LVTEKAANHQTTESTYSFIVAKDANKIEISKAVMELYGVEPVSVRTANVQGRAVRFGQGFGKRGDFKKAMVTLKKGDSITIHEGV